MLLRCGRPSTGKETVGEVFSPDRFQQRLVKQVIQVPWSFPSIYRCRRWQNSWLDVPMIVVELAVSSVKLCLLGPETET